MRNRIVHLLLLGLQVLSVRDAFSQRSDIKPYDFEPLTSLPWKDDPSAKMTKVLERIYLEPEAKVRYAVLEAYLRQLPTDQLWKAYEACQPLEGSCHIDWLARAFMPIAAERTPHEALDKYVAFQRIEYGGWLDFDSWARPRLEVADLDAFRKSSYLIPSAPDGYLLGLDRAKVSQDERKKLLRDYTCIWIDRSGTLPVMPPPAQVVSIQEREIDFLNADWDEETLEHILLSETPLKGPVEIAFAARAFALRFPKSMSRLLQWVDAEGVHAFVPSVGVLLCWVKADFESMKDYIETCERRLDPLAPAIMGILLSRVDVATRNRWMPFVRRPDNLANLPRLGEILTEWAKWDPKEALQAAVDTQDVSIIHDVAESAAFGLDSLCYNTCHAGLGVIRDFDVSSLPAPLMKELINEWGVEIMEQWGDVDVAEAARYGLKFMLATNYTPRQNLIKLFSGDDKFASDSDMIDRTFCAFRTWAVWRPVEMEKWIATLNDPEMQKALNWLKDNPWGTGAPE